MELPSLDLESRIWRLYRAIREGDLAAVETLSKEGLHPRTPIPPVTPDSRSANPIEIAIYSERTEIVSLLLRFGADPHQHAGQGLAPLTIASMLGLTPIVRLILESGADPNHVDPGGAGTALMAAADDGYLEIVDLLLNAGADPNLSVDDETALDIARAKATRRKRIIRRLVAAGAVE